MRVCPFVRPCLAKTRIIKAYGALEVYRTMRKHGLVSIGGSECDSVCLSTLEVASLHPCVVPPRYLLDCGLYCVKRILKMLYTGSPMSPIPTNRD